MLRRFMVLLVWLLGLVVALLALLWLILDAPIFADLRRSVVESALSEQIGQKLVVKEDVRVKIGPTTRVFASGVEIPSENMDDTLLAQLNHLELELSLPFLFQGLVEIDNLKVDGLQVNLLTRQDGVTSWTPEERSTPKPTPPRDAQHDDIVTLRAEQTGGGLFAFLKDKTVSFTRIGLKIDSEESGFTFDFTLEHLRLDQLDGGRLVSVTSEGSVNGEPFSIDGEYPRGKPFTTAATFGQLRADFNGHPFPDDQGGGFTGTLALDTGEIGEVLDILRLDRVLEGRGYLSTDITNRGDTLKIEALDINVALDDGQLFTVAGDVEDLLKGTGFDISVNARLHPEGKPPPVAEKLKDLKLTDISAHIISEGAALKFEDLLFTTNAFDQNLNQVGPVSIGRIVRSDSGQLSLLDVTLQIGPIDAPIVKANGDLKDVLQLKGLDLRGTLTAPATLVLQELGKGDTEAFGSFNAEFTVSDAAGHISLPELHATANDTQLWSLELNSIVPSVTEFDGLKFDLALGIPDSIAFLTALDVGPVDVGSLGFSLAVEGKENNLEMAASVLAGNSRLNGTIDATKTESGPVVRGLISSETVGIDDLKHAIAWTAGILSLGRQENTDKESESDTAAKSPDGKVEEPLILPKKEDPAPEASADFPDDGKIEEPLVLGTGDPADGKPGDLVDAADKLAQLDLEIGIAIEKIVGQQGISSISSDLTIKEAQAKLGPLEFSYGGGYFNLSAGMDLIEKPDLLNISGATSGWDLGDILKTAGVDMDAHGNLRAQFNLTGNRASAKTFVNSMYGSVTASMSGGTIATSLLELAGLGIFPWLFSAELNKGYSDIVCVVAPVRIQAGKVSSNAIVAETKSVQMVVSGSLDWRNDTISMRAEPRPVGRPLARSAWPINISGRLSKPEFKVLVGGVRAKRADGASSLAAGRQPCKPDIQQLE